MKDRTFQAILVIAVIAGLFILNGMGFFSNLGGQVQSVTGQAPAGQPAILAVKDANVRVTASEKYTGEVPDVNAELRSSTGATVVAETQVNARGASLSTSAPTTFNGYLMLGNDNEVSGTDRGPEVYYKKVPVSWTSQSNVELGPYLLYNESTPTWVGYDDGVSETTLNITVGEGQTVTSTELKISAGADGALGNPEFDRPLAVCFNSTNYASFDEIRPAVYDSTIPVPGFLSSRNIVGGKCYVLPTSAVADYGEYRFYIVIDPISTFNPSASENAYALLIDKTYYIDDNNNWVEGWGDESDLVSDADIGMATFGNEKLIAMN